MNEMVDRLIQALDKALEQRVYGLYDYSSYPGNAPPHVVVYEFTNETIFRSNDRNEAQSKYDELRKSWVIKTLIHAMREPTEEMLEAGILNYKDDPTFKCATHKSYVAMIDEILK